MRFTFLTLAIFTTACASKTPHPAVSTEPVAHVIAAATTPAFELEQALQGGEPVTLAKLKSQSTAQSFGELSSRDPAASLPEDLKVEKTQATTKDHTQQVFLRKFHNWSFHRKMARAGQLLDGFQCGNAVEAQSMGFSLELDFPSEEAMKTSEALHEKVLVCHAFPRQESLFKLAVFAIQRGECPKATEYLEMFPAALERGVSDRLAYLHGLCSPTLVNERNPWGGYGILLSEPKAAEATHPQWTLNTSSGDANWDRLLVTFIELEQKGHHDVVQYLATKLNYEKFRSLPLSFQTSMLVLMSFSGADLPVFQTLHHYLSEHPDHASPAVEGLLFPIRYWEQIVENSKGTDPILVKALIRQESAFNPQARSRARAAGLMQLVYPTAKHFGIHRPKELLSPEANIHAGAEFLAHLISEFGSVDLALAAYNAGPALVHQWQKRYPTSNMDLFVEMIPYTETREYVRLVRRNYKVYQSLLTKPQTLTGNTPAD